MLGPGRPAKRPEILAVRELSREEVLATPKAAPNLPKQLRDHHHRIARLYAMGLRTSEVSHATGYSMARLSVLRQSPAMEQLISDYRVDVNADWREEVKDYYGEADRLRTSSLRQIGQQLDKADETGETLPISTLLRIHDSLADRTGYPKRKENVNLNVDFADQLEKARLRSAKVIELRPEIASSPLPKTGGGADRVDAVVLPPPKLLRRI